MALYLFGLNHNTAPVEVRERIAFNEDNSLAALPILTDGSTINEALILSTCNRVEILIESSASESEIEKRIGDFLFSVHRTPFAEIAPHLYRLRDAEVALHLFRVASSLDSMLLGETQIQGQVRQAYKTATEAGTAKRNLHKLLHHAFHAAKRVRTETEIGGSAVSMASAAIELARKTFGTLEYKSVLIVGAGEMAQAAVRHVKQASAGQIAICNRTLEKAALLAVEAGGAVVAFENLASALKQSDVVICSTSASEYLINRETARAAQAARGARQTLFVDISVPRNIAPDVKEIENLILADVDDLQTAIASNVESRRREAVRAEAIIAEEVEEFLISLRAMNIGERLGLLREKLQSTAAAEFAKHRGKLGDLTEEQENAVQNLLFSAVNKISHPILYGLRRSHEETGADEFVEILCSLLGGEDLPQRDTETKKQ